MTYGLTLKQAKVYELIEIRLAQDGFSPSVREIANHLGLASTASVHAVLERLKARGLIRWIPNSARSIYLTDGLGLPPGVEKQLSAYCERTGERRANIIGEAVRVYLRDLEHCEAA